MRLKRLEIRGFKSFADKTVINFSEDVIGIVGSNGCGKSNIVDAVRWVLGEQRSRMLRSDNMSNVIFNGTKTRKQSGFAEVTLLFENNKNILPTEYQEVAIKRTLYKDGSSEYRLNEVKCRLKDIFDLLADTGMSSNSYAIIALNMVDDLLQDKENARIQLFEQAAGISKFKVRKKETMRKLTGTEADLMRVEDRLAEIEKNLKSLARQAKRAEKYLNIKATYRKLSLEAAYLEGRKMQESYEGLKGKIETQKKILEDQEENIQAAEKYVEREKIDNIQKEQKLAELKRQLNKLVGNIKAKENDLKIIEQKIRFIQQNEERLKKRIAESDEQIKLHTKNQTQHQESLEAEEQVLGILEVEFSEHQTKLEQARAAHETLQKKQDELQKAQRQVQQQLNETEKQIAIRDHQQNTYKQNIERSKNQVLQRQKQFEETEQRLGEFG